MSAVRPGRAAVRRNLGGWDEVGDFRGDRRLTAPAAPKLGANVCGPRGGPFVVFACGDTTDLDERPTVNGTARLGLTISAPLTLHAGGGRRRQPDRSGSR